MEMEELLDEEDFLDEVEEVEDILFLDLWRVLVF